MDEAVAAANSNSNPSDKGNNIDGNCAESSGPKKDGGESVKSCPVL